MTVALTTPSNRLHITYRDRLMCEFRTLPMQNLVKFAKMRTFMGILQFRRPKKNNRPKKKDQRGDPWKCNKNQRVPPLIFF